MPAAPLLPPCAAELLLQHSDSGDAPQDVLMADLASRDISSIADAAAAAAVPADACDNGAPAPQQQQQPWGLGAFVSLVSLDLSDNRLACIAGLAALPSLQHLVVSANRLRDLSGLAHAQGCSQQQPAPAELLGDGAAGSSSGGSSSSVLAAAVDGADAAVQETAARATDANEAPGGQQQQHQCASEAAAAAPLLQPLPCTTTSFCLLEVLDVSYNMLTAEQLLGPWSPLGHLPR
jgi:Leucine-rich repeat (LRR) protein